MASNIPHAVKFFALVAAASICLAAAGREPRAQSGHIVGRPGVIDADTLDFAGRRVEISGIDGPELDQTCGVGAGQWRCGLEARWALLNRVGRHWVTCVPEETTGPGARRAVCYLAGAGQLDLAAWLVARGWALAEPGTGSAYLAQEAAAQRSGKGLWRGQFTAPWDWRRSHELKE